jgi:hypothetical protein
LVRQCRDDLGFRAATITSVADLLKAVAWPAAAVFIAVALRTELKGFLKKLAEAVPRMKSVKVPGAQVELAYELRDLAEDMSSRPAVMGSAEGSVRFEAAPVQGQATEDAGDHTEVHGADQAQAAGSGTAEVSPRSTARESPRPSRLVQMDRQDLLRETTKALASSLRFEAAGSPADAVRRSFGLVVQESEKIFQWTRGLPQPARGLKNDPDMGESAKALLRNANVLLREDLLEPDLYTQLVRLAEVVRTAAEFGDQLRAEIAVGIVDTCAAMVESLSLAGIVARDRLQQQVQQERRFDRELEQRISQEIVDRIRYEENGG